MAAIKIRVTKLESRYGIASFEDLIRRMTIEDLERLCALYELSRIGQADEATLAEIQAIERRYRRPQSAPAG